MATDRGSSKTLMTLAIAALVASGCSGMVAPTTSTGSAVQSKVSGDATANSTLAGASASASGSPKSTATGDAQQNSGTAVATATTTTTDTSTDTTATTTATGTATDTAPVETSVGKLTVATNSLKDFNPNSSYGYYIEKSVSISILHTDGVTQASLKKRVERYDCHDCDAAAPKCACQDKGTTACAYKQITMSFTGFPAKDSYALKGDSSDYAGGAIIMYSDGTASAMTPKGSLAFAAGLRPAKVDDPYTADVDLTFTIGATTGAFKGKVEGSIYSLTAPTTTPPTCKATQYLEPIYATN
jgi:hypothetical protein